MFRLGALLMSRTAAGLLVFLVLLWLVPERDRSEQMKFPLSLAAKPLPGFMSFCERHPEECMSDAQPSVVSDIDVESVRLGDLWLINRAVNVAIAPVTDLELYGVNEFWELPVDRGDCEDYALLKRKILRGMGWPVASLLLTVVRDHADDAHVVLVARTAFGDLTLDNKSEDILPPAVTGYRFVSQQSEEDPMRWVWLDPNGRTLPSADVAGID